MSTLGEVVVVVRQLQQQAQALLAQSEQHQEAIQQLQQELAKTTGKKNSLSEKAGRVWGFGGKAESWGDWAFRPKRHVMAIQP